MPTDVSTSKKPALSRFFDGIERSVKYQYITSMALSLLTGLGLALVSVLITRQGLHSSLEWIVSNPLALLTTTLFLGLLVLLLFRLSNSLFASSIVISILVLAASLVNHFKMLITSTPFYLSDIGLIGKLKDITRLNSSSITFSRNILLGIIAVVIWLVILFFFSRRIKPAAMCRLICAAGELLVFGLVFLLKPAANALIYLPCSVDIGQSYNQSYVYDKVGVPLGLWHSALNLIYAEPAFDESRMPEVLDAAQGYIDEIEPGGSDTKPNVIFILSESFADVTKLPGVTYSADPLTDYHNAQLEGVSGTFYTRSLGYGTCNIELELLTGVNTRFLTTDRQLCYMSPNDFANLPAVPREFSDNGYYTAFLHMFNDSIYNRTPIYSQLGFDDIYFTDSFAQIDDDAAAAEDYWAFMEGKISGEFYSDDYMADLLIDLYEKKSGDSPVFLYAASMENHTPFTGNKYSSYDYPFASSLGKDARDCLNAYTQGCANASKSLGKLIDYFSQTPEPTIIVFFGDHRAGLPLDGDGTVYSALGMCSDQEGSKWPVETIARLYSTDYLIWSNDKSLLPDEAGSRLDTSSAYLGLDTLRTAGIRLDPYWRMIASVKESCTAYEWLYAVGSDGRIYSELPDTLDPDKFDTMAWLMRQALADSSDIAFYKLRD